MKNLIKTIGLTWLALTSQAGAFTLSQITESSGMVEVLYPANQLTLNIFTKPNLRPGTFAPGTTWANITLQAEGPGLLGLRWSPDQPRAEVYRGDRIAVIYGYYNPRNKLKVEFWMPNANWKDVEGESFFVLNTAASNIGMDATLNSSSEETIVVADRYEARLEAAIYRP
ncbi:hypothetical protein [Enterobacter asburiae]|uniref:hypothetical protein n=1 Tax=Enterobacter asburiae TaxID=61645 RepID=UPI0010CA3C95|nr:hypothetical protein [Enterobacter asburiae]BBJ65402.1 hypothetical protein EAS1808013_p11070 [Enterobacter asburiae]HDX4013798.1 hypothetical protein [Enterobacter asburiae]